MTSVKQSQLAGIAALAASLLMVELLAHQLVTGVRDSGFGLMVALSLPLATALGALLSSNGMRGRNPAWLQARAAHLTLVGGGLLVATVVAITWASRRIAKAKGTTEWADIAALSVGWLLSCLLFGAALALVLRAAKARLGRAVFSMAVGMALAAVALPRLLMLQAPHLALLVAGLVAAAALLLGHAGRAARPHWASLWTLPLVVTALYAGDIGAPWLKVRTDIGRSSQIEHREWTPEGLIEVNRIRRGKGSFTLGPSPSIPLAKALKNKQKPPFKKQDLIYSLNPKKRGPVLVVASLGGREVVAAQAYGHTSVSAIEPQGQLLNQLLLNKYAAVSGNALYDPSHIALSVGDGRTGLAQHWERYQFVVAMGDSYLRQVPPRLLSSSHRSYTHEALAGYLSCLDPAQDGAVLVRVAEHDQLARVVASAREALAPRAHDPLQHIAVCGGGDDDAVVLMTLSPLKARIIRVLSQKCRKGRTALLYPPKPTRSGRKPTPKDDHKAAAAERLLDGAPLSDSMPFLELPPMPGLLGATAQDALDTLKPVDPVAKAKAAKAKAKAAKAKAKAAKAKAKAEAKAKAKGAKGKAVKGRTDKSKAAKAKTDKGKATKDAEKLLGDQPDEEPSVDLTALQRHIGLGAAATVSAVLLALLAMMLLPSRAQRVAGPAIRLALPLFGIATAVVLFTLSELTLNALGNAAFAWSLVVPMGLLGWGAGGLSADVAPADARRRALMRAGVIGVALLILTGLAAGPLQLMDKLNVQGAVLTGALWLLLAGAALGAPVVLSAKLLATHTDRAASWSWAAHATGWALGSAAVGVAVHYMTLQKLLLTGIVIYAAATVLLAVSLRRPATE